MKRLVLLKRLRVWFKSRHFGRSSIDTRYALAEACLIGVLSGIAALVLKTGVGWLGGLRLQVSHQFGAWLVLPLAGLILGCLAGWIIESFSPAAAGGGIPQVKAALARYPVTLSLRVAIVKLIGAILVLGSGLTLGRRAPTVHIGAALAAQLSCWIPTSPEHRRQMIAAGAASGLAASFTTPIAGVLFVIEELMRDVSGLTLETAIVASFIGAVVSMSLPFGGGFSPTLLLQPLQISFSTAEIPCYIFLGILAGVLGAFFNRGVLFCAKIQRKLDLPLAWRIGLVGLISGITIAFLPPFFRDNAGLREFLISGELSSYNIIIAFIAHFFLTMIAYASGAPGGLLAPALVMGSALGYLVGDVAAYITGVDAEATYALAGMGAFFTAVVRAPVTAIIIVFELRANFSIVLPLMVTCAVSYLIAENVFARSLYEHLLEASGIQLTEEKPLNDFLTQLTASDVMQTQVETLASNITLKEVIQSMSESRHRGFPVVEDGRLVGIVTQSDLAHLQEQSGETLLREIMTLKPITVDPETSLSDVLYLLNRYQLSRLPVIEINKVVGIITRTDIIRTEAKQLGGATESPKPAPSYIIYQTRAPATGKGRILLPLSNPQNASILMQMAIAIARHHHYEIECLQVIKIPSHSPPSETRVDVRESRKLMQRMERLGRHHQISTHTQIRIAQDIAVAILDVIHERHINLLFMGWKGKSTTQGAIFGDVADILIHRATCDLMLVKLGNNPKTFPFYLNDNAIWLLPMAGGPNAQRAIELLPGLTKLYTQNDTPEIWLCKVYSPSGNDPDYQDLLNVVNTLQSDLNKPVIPVPLCSPSVVDAVREVAQIQHCELIILGASREGLLQQVIHGNIPSAIAKGIDSTVILVRTAIE